MIFEVFLGYVQKSCKDLYREINVVLLIVSVFCGFNGLSKDHHLLWLMGNRSHSFIGCEKSSF